MDRRLPELLVLEQLIANAGQDVEVRQLCQIDTGERRLPVHALLFGNPDPRLPAIGFFGGVHGLERIGTQVVITHLQSLMARLRWDRVLHRQLDDIRLVFVPLINPGGFWRRTRANPNGVDLMRNAPVEAIEKVPFLLSGQRYSRNLPWYRGKLGEPMESEASALCALVESELLGRQFSIAIDCHSGFGISDRIWFPYAHSSAPITHLAELHALKEILDQSHLHHTYVFEPQSRQYLTHGDLWDYLYLRSLDNEAQVFLPLTLEMGSWTWVKKNPRQLFSRHGMFNPLIEHRQQRVLRRHIGLLDFMTRAAISHALWLPQDPARAGHHDAAMACWYEAASAG